MSCTNQGRPSRWQASRVSMRAARRHSSNASMSRCSWKCALASANHASSRSRRQADRIGSAVAGSTSCAIRSITRLVCERGVSVAGVPSGGRSIPSNTRSRPRHPRASPSGSGGCRGLPHRPRRRGPLQSGIVIADEAVRRDPGPRRSRGVGVSLRSRSREKRFDVIGTGVAAVDKPLESLGDGHQVVEALRLEPTGLPGTRRTGRIHDTSTAPRKPTGCQGTQPPGPTNGLSYDVSGPPPPCPILLCGLVGFPGIMVLPQVPSEESLPWIRSRCAPKPAAKQAQGRPGRLRREGLVPATLYGRGIDAITVAVDQRELYAALTTERA